jgi:glycogen debranching enzyme
MIKVNPIFNNINLLEKVYNTIKQLTQFWMNYRTSENGLPYYIHGNESGWDNGTFFRDGVPMNTPDLSAFLIRQMDFLSNLSKDIGLKNESVQWKERADALFESFMVQLYDDEFIAYKPFNQVTIRSHHTLQRFLPLMIHYRLDNDIKDKMTKEIEDLFLTDFGLATESVESPLYRKNGYWRGPIWAPTMLMFIDFFEEMDHPLHMDLVNKFFNCMSENGMAENYDPKTGEGLKDPAFAWTSSVYLHLKLRYNL